MGKDENKKYPKREAFNQVNMGKKGFKVSRLLQALNLNPFKPDNKRDKKSK